MITKSRFGDKNLSEYKSYNNRKEPIQFNIFNMEQKGPTDNTTYSRLGGAGADSEDQLSQIVVGNRTNGILWYEETTSGQQVPVGNYQPDIEEKDQEAFDKIKWRDIPLHRVNMMAVKNNSAIEKYKPEQIVYNNKDNSYVKLVKLVLKKELEGGKIEEAHWEAVKVPREPPSDPKKKQPEEKVSIEQKDIGLYLNIEIMMMGFEIKEVSPSYLRVHIEEKLQTILDSLEQLHQMKFLPIYDGKLLNISKTFIENYIPEKATIFFYGAISEVPITSNFQVRFFKRFVSLRGGDSWYVGFEKWDALKFIPNRDIVVHGTGLFERHPNGGNFELGYKYIILDSSDRELFKSATFIEPVNPTPEIIVDRLFKHKFTSHPNGIEVKAGQKYVFCQWIRGCDHTYYTESGNNHREVEENPDRDLFKVENSDLSSNSTTSNRGVIGGVMYSLK
ncbi:hypothetical protein FGO68_gene5627 [Halteria grandinella]|uniref:PHR domain-containing protein n=1 Tax=Halteria grandinella TaxID=5974 RepID=A0A8J8NYY3_HALGN|nr:hypothetical protein FGO68_gene5627 [Halteria grandinella]